MIGHILLLYKTLKLLKVISMLRLQEFRFYYTYEHNKLPNLPLKFHISIHSYATRTEHEIKTKSWICKNCMQYDIPNVVNSTPNSIIAKMYTHSLQSFSGYIK